MKYEQRTTQHITEKRNSFKNRAESFNFSMFLTNLGQEAWMLGSGLSLISNSDCLINERDFR